MKVLILLAGNGVYDGSETHESVLTMLALDEQGIRYQCAALDMNQMHVVNHVNGEEMNESRNILIESARIARGDIIPLSQAAAQEYDALVIPGGFGAAKNLSDWAVKGPEAKIVPEVKRVILEFIDSQKPILALCIAPTAIALALKESGKKPMLTLGTTQEKSPYDIAGLHEGLQAVGAEAVMSSVLDYVYDEKNKIITSPCYMQEVNIGKIRQGTQKAVEKLATLLHG